MPVTGLRGRQILDGDVFRNDLNITTSGSAVIRRIIAGTNITISSTGVDTGTGDVTINAATPTITLQNIPDAWIKDSVRAATTANITLSAAQTIDGISVVAGDRVLVKNQTTASENGIYVCAAGAWTRATDADVASEIAAAMVAVDSGTTNGGTTWDTDFKSTDTLGTTAMSWHRVIDTGYGAALTKTDDTNVTLTLGGSPSTALIQATSLTLGWSGQLSVGRGGTGASTLTGVLIGNGTSAFTGVAGTALQLLRRNSGNTAYEFFTGGNITKTDDTNVTLSLGGTPTGSTINSVSFTLGWSGQLSVARGGTGASTLTGVLIGNGTGAVTAVAGTASQLLRRNAGNTAYEFFTHDFASTAGATFTGQIVSTLANSTTTGGGQIYLNGATGNRIDFNQNGVAAPSFTTRSVGTKIVLFPELNASNADYAIGIEGNTLWFSVPTNANQNFKWYGGTTQQMQLTSGNLVVGSSTTASGKLYVYNTNTALVSTRIDTISALTSLQTSVPLQLSDYYNSGANGHQLYFNSTAAAGVWEYNITKNWGGILTFGSSSSGTSHKRDLYIYDSGQLRFANYTTTTSFTGTAVGVLAFTSDGSIITIATPGGGSGLTGSGTANYVSKFTAGTSLGNSQIFDNGTNVGINQASPQARLHITPATGFNTLQLDCSSSYEILFGGNNIANIYHGDVGQPIYLNTNGGAIYMGAANASTNFQITSTVIQASIPLVIGSAGAQMKIIGGATDAGIFMGAANSFLYVADWATGTNGLVVDVATGVTYTRSSLANGGYFVFQRSGATAYGYIGNASQLVASGVNTDLAIRSENAIMFSSGTATRARILATGQLRLDTYTTTTSYTGTAVGYLAFDSSGNVLTVTAPSGSSQWVTSGSNIYYTTGNVSIGTTSSSDLLHLSTASGTALYIRFNQLTRTAWQLGQAGGSDAFQLVNASAAATRMQVLSTGQFVFNAYTAYNSFSATDAQGVLAFDTSGNIISIYPPIFRHTFVTSPVTANNVPANVSFFASSNAYVTEMDLTGKKRARLTARVTTAATAGTILRVRYAATFSTTASSYLLMGSTEIEVAISTTGIITSGWINLVAGAKIGVCYVALQTIGGDGSTDPVLAQIAFEAEE